MEMSLVVAGFGGQGVLFAGRLLAYAGMNSGYNVTWIPSYGPEMRGGTAHCVVIISDEPIGSPLTSRPDIALVLNQPSYDKYEPLVRPGGLLVVNRSLVTATSARKDIETVSIPANLYAEAFEAPKSLNMALVGAFLARRPILSLAAVEEALEGHGSAESQHLSEINRQVLRRGYYAARPVTKDVAIPEPTL